MSLLYQQSKDRESAIKKLLEAKFPQIVYTVIWEHQADKIMASDEFKAFIKINKITPPKVIEDREFFYGG